MPNQTKSDDQSLEKQETTMIDRVDTIIIKIDDLPDTCGCGMNNGETGKRRVEVIGTGKRNG